MIEEKVLKNLRIDGKENILIVSPPEAFQAALKTRKYDIKPVKSLTGKYDYVQIFATNQDDLEKKLIQYRDQGKFDCMFWACYPKKTGNIKSNVFRETVWSALELIGLYAVTSVAIDDTWSALRGRPDELVKKQC